MRSKKQGKYFETSIILNWIAMFFFFTWGIIAIFNDDWINCIFPFFIGTFILIEMWKELGVLDDNSKKKLGVMRNE